MDLKAINEKEKTVEQVTRAADDYSFVRVIVPIANDRVYENGPWLGLLLEGVEEPDSDVW